MIKTVLFVALVCVCNCARFGSKCDYSPTDLLYDDSWVCNRNNPLGICDNKAIYPANAIAEALVASQEHQAFLHDTGSCLLPQDDIYSYRGKDYFYSNICKPNKNFIDTVLIKNTMCYVMKPQQLYYATCGDPHSPIGGRCRLGYAFLPNYYCVQSGYVKRKVLVFCPSLVPQCQYHQMTLPSTCSCKGFFCGAPKMF